MQRKSMPNRQKFMVRPLEDYGKNMMFSKNNPNELKRMRPPVNRRRKDKPAPPR